MMIQELIAQLNEIADRVGPDARVFDWDHGDLAEIELNSGKANDELVCFINLLPPHLARAKAEAAERDRKVTT